MADVGVRVTLDGLNETQQGLGTLEEGLKKLAERSPENARKLANTISVVTAAVAAQASGKMAEAATSIEASNNRSGESVLALLELQKRQGVISSDAADQIVDALSKLETKNQEVIVSSKEIIDLQEKQAIATKRLQEAYDKYVASQVAACKPVLVGPGGEALTAPPSGQPPILVPTSSGGGTRVFEKSGPPIDFQKWAEEAGLAEGETKGLSDEMQKLIAKYDPLTVKLKQATDAQQAYRKALVTGELDKLSLDTLQKIEKGLNDEIAKTKAAMTGAKEETNGFSASLVTLGLLYVAPLALAHQFISKMWETVAAGREAALQNIRLNAVLQATGMVSGFTAKQLDALSESMEKTTAFDNDKLKQAMSTLLIFGNVQGDTFTRAIKLGTDYARLTGGDIVSATRLFGRALEVPEHGLASLSRLLGPASAETKRLSKEMSDMGDVVGGQALILEFAEKKIKGLAETIGKSGVAEAERFSVAWGNLMKEGARTAFDPSGAGGGIYATMTKIVDAIKSGHKIAIDYAAKLVLDYYKYQLNYADLSVTERIELEKKYNEQRKALGIQTEQEIADEQSKIRQSQAEKETERINTFMMASYNKMVKEIDDEIALGKKTLENKRSLLHAAAQMAELTGKSNTEVLHFLAQEEVVRKQIVSHKMAEVSAIGQLSALDGQRMQALISSELALGRVSREQYEEKKTAEELYRNQRSLTLEEHWLSQNRIGSEEHKQAQRKILNLKFERELIETRGKAALDAALKTRFDDEMKLLETRAKTAVEVTEIESRFVTTQAEKLQGMEFELSLIGKTEVAKKTAIALRELENEQIRVLADIMEKYTDAESGMLTVNIDVYQRSIDRINARFTLMRDGMPSIIKSLTEEEQRIKDIESAMQSLGQTFTSSFEEALAGGKSFRDILKGIERDLIQIGTRLLVTNPFMRWLETAQKTGGGNPFMNVLNAGIGVIGGLFGGGTTGAFAAVEGISDAGIAAELAGGFQHGGSFTIGGVGGLDSQMVRFKGTPGEKVTVETPDQQRSGRSGMTLVFNGPLINVQANDVGSFNRARGHIGSETAVWLEGMRARFS